MNNKKSNIVIGIIAVVAVILGLLAYNKPAPQPTLGNTGGQGIQGERGLTGPQGVQGVRGPVGPQGARGSAGSNGSNGADKLGSVSGPDLYSPYWDVNGVFTFFSRVALTAGTSTPCVSPAVVATSTLRNVTIMAMATGTASQWTIATSSSSGATTSPLVTDYVVASGKGTTISFSAGQSSIGGVNNYLATSSAILLPGNVVTVGATGGKDGNSTNGTNQALYASSSPLIPMAGSFCTFEIRQF